MNNWQTALTHCQMSDMVETEKAAAKVPSDDAKAAPGEESANSASPGPGKSDPSKSSLI